jgi:endoglucanase
MILGLLPSRRDERPTHRRRRLAAVALTGVAAVLVAVLLLRGGGDAGAGGRSEASAAAAADAFLGRYVEPDGRVSRHDQGGDTVSEGQAYAMLLAAERGKARTFAKVWDWTRENLRRPDGLLAWHWEGGKVVDPHSAADGDLDAAWALLRGARRFGEPEYRAEALKLGSAILEHETVSLDGRSLLVGGDWATTFPAVVDPSYFSPAAFTALGRASGDPRWRQLAATSGEVVSELTDRPTGLAPDWATVAPDGTATPSAPPGEGGEAIFGYDAVRVPIWQASGCQGSGRESAARSAPFLDEAMGGASPAAEYSLEGEPREGDAGAAILVATAAANAAAGEVAEAREWLDRAAAADEAEPTYYGGALVALGRAALEPDGGLGC